MLDLPKDSDIGVPTGMIMPYISTTLNGWLLCDGGIFDVVAYPDLFLLLGDNHTPIMTDFFPRASITQSEIDGFVMQGQLTRMPRTGSWTLASAGSHFHRLGIQIRNYVGGSWRGATELPGVPSAAAGNHNHTSYTGGDTFTRPPHMKLAYLIKT